MNINKLFGLNHNVFKGACDAYDMLILVVAYLLSERQALELSKPSMFL